MSKANNTCKKCGQRAYSGQPGMYEWQCIPHTEDCPDYPSDGQRQDIERRERDARHTLAKEAATRFARAGVETEVKFDRVTISAADADRLSKMVDPDGIREAMIGLGDPRSSVERTLLVCAQAAHHLESVMDWDGHGWEVVRGAVRVAAAYLDGRMPTPEDYGCGGPTDAVHRLMGSAFGIRGE